MMFCKSSTYSAYLLKSLEGPILSDDPELLTYIRTEILKPPSPLDYNLRNYIHDKLNEDNSTLFYRNFSKEFFRFKRDGFFIEAGALDGEILSNTLWLEKNLGWTGLLVEPDPYSFRRLENKNRKAWLANVCLSIYSYPKKEKMLNKMKNIEDEYTQIRVNSLGSLYEKQSKKQNASELQKKWLSAYYSQCFTLESLLLALNITRVELFSLDVERAEEDIIKNFNFLKFNVQVIYLEWKQRDKMLWLSGFLKDKGYVFAADSPLNIIFVKKNSEYNKILDQKYQFRKMKIYTVFNYDKKLLSE